ncbi:MAG: UDP-galactopyranose mutase, partial [Oscillospiraceae bacterium]|nr:UDP-galactopyranose mutase [Oscillospiraceae bacterium]
YYAILNPKNLEQYQRYRDLSAALPRFHLLGRLAEYKYYNMDAIVHQALLLADRLMEEQENESV